MNYYIVKYTGPFGFIKPWTAVRDSEIFSQQFLTPSIIMGMERKLFPELLAKSNKIHKIVGHRLRFESRSAQQEMIQPKGWNTKKVNYKWAMVRPYSILIRNVLVNPTLLLAFTSEKDAEVAAIQHICCCRNEDILLPEEIITTTTVDFENDENNFTGFELIFEKTADSFVVGYNRFKQGEPMFGWLKVIGNPTILNQ